jgi:hypothetical protein
MKVFMVGSVSIKLVSKEINLGGVFCKGQILLQGKTKTATVNVQWLTKNGKIIGQSIKLNPAKGLGELLQLIKERTE